MKTYSDDRLSICQEIEELLKTRGHWIPKETASSDLIHAIADALNKEYERGKKGIVFEPLSFYAGKQL